MGNSTDDGQFSEILVEGDENSFFLKSHIENFFVPRIRIGIAHPKDIMSGRG